MCAINTETGISIVAIMAPSPIPVRGIPFVNSNGGRIVPNKERMRPQRRNIFKRETLNLLSKSLQHLKIALQKLFSKITVSALTWKNKGRTCSNLARYIKVESELGNGTRFIVLI
jgi:hypothetical protein